jgi:8-oxo-dGTP diphosphatase
MRWEEQGTLHTNRYVVVPRALILALHDGDVLLLRGAPDKRLWAGKLNGVGGHIEADESVHAAARREFLEETGLDVPDLRLRGVVHIAGRGPHPGVMMFVLVGRAPSRRTAHSGEGTLEWHDPNRLPLADLVEDLPELLPRVLKADREDAMVYGHYTADAEGRMAFCFDDTRAQDAAQG